MNKKLLGMGVLSPYNFMIHTFADMWTEIALTILQLKYVSYVCDQPHCLAIKTEGSIFKHNVHQRGILSFIEFIRNFLKRHLP